MENMLITDKKTGVYCTIEKKETAIEIIFHGANNFKDYFFAALCWRKKNGWHFGAHYIAKEFNREHGMEIYKYVFDTSGDKNLNIHIKAYSAGCPAAYMIYRILNRITRTYNNCEFSFFGAYRFLPNGEGCCYNLKYGFMYKGYKHVYGNDIVTKLFPWFVAPGDKVHKGDQEKWYKFSAKDHRIENYKGMGL